MIILYAKRQYLETVVVEAKRIKEAIISALALCYTNSYPTHMKIGIQQHAGPVQGHGFARRLWEWVKGLIPECPTDEENK